MDTIDIKMMHTDEIKELQKKVNRELRFRENVGREIETSIDKELKSAYTLKESLESELTRAEIMSDRIPIREDLREVNDQISKLKIKQLKETVPDMADYVDQSWRVG